MTKKPLVLVILDGFGHRESPDDNAIYHAQTPHWDALMANAPHTLVSGSGEDVGLPAGQMGNSEVGHMSLGSGRIIYQNISRIDKAIRDGDFFDNPAYSKAIDGAKANQSAVHIFGLLSPGGVHSHDSHIHAMCEMAAKRGAQKVYVHAFLDGRDTPPRSAQASIEALEAKLEALGTGTIASLCGRYYAMDRDNRWDRVEKAWKLMVDGEADHKSDSATVALEAAYGRDENDEFVAPTLINGVDARIGDGDSVIFMNFRADRARELTRAFTEPDFDKFTRTATPKLHSFVTTTEYAADIDADVAFPSEAIANSLGEIMAKQGKTQLRIAETEKYAHVTFFFSGGREQEFDGETRSLIPSPDVATYDLKPEMSAPEVTDNMVQAITGGQYDLIVCNYANGDMVGHTGNFDAALKAVEALDVSVGRVIDAVQDVGGQCLITADHGNCEQMLDYESGQLHTQHTTEHVPLVYVGPKPITLSDGGILADIAPTALALMGVAQPTEMTGKNLALGADAVTQTSTAA